MFSIVIVRRNSSVDVPSTSVTADDELALAVGDLRGVDVQDDRARDSRRRDTSPSGEVLGLESARRRATRRRSQRYAVGRRLDGQVQPPGGGVAPARAFPSASADATDGTTSNAAQTISRPRTRADILPIRARYPPALPRHKLSSLHISAASIGRRRRREPLERELELARLGVLGHLEQQAAAGLEADLDAHRAVEAVRAGRLHARAPAWPRRPRSAGARSASSLSWMAMPVLREPQAHADVAHPGPRRSEVAGRIDEAGDRRAQADADVGAGQRDRVADRAGRRARRLVVLGLDVRARGHRRVTAAVELAHGARVALLERLRGGGRRRRRGRGGRRGLGRGRRGRRLRLVRSAPCGEDRHYRDQTRATSALLTPSDGESAGLAAGALDLTSSSRSAHGVVVDSVNVRVLLYVPARSASVRADRLAQVERQRSGRDRRAPAPEQAAARRGLAERRERRQRAVAQADRAGLQRRGQRERAVDQVAGGRRATCRSRVSAASPVVVVTVAGSAVL